MFQKLGDALRRFMYGRYGADSLNKWLLIFAVVLMLLTGKWTTKGVHTVEEFDPDPYLDALDKYGLPRSESHNPALVD